MTRPEITGREALQLGPTGSLVASPNETMTYLGVGRTTLYGLISAGEIESYLQGSPQDPLAINPCLRPTQAGKRRIHAGRPPTE